MEDNYFNRNTSAAVPAAKREPNPHRSAGQLTNARVYALEFNNRAIKIGQSNDVDKRKSRVSGKSKLAVKRTYFNPHMPCKIARLIEKACHKIFFFVQNRRRIFSAEFEKMCKVLHCFVNVIANLPLITNFERGKVLAHLALSMKDSPAKENITLSAKKIIADKNLNFFCSNATSSALLFCCRESSRPLKKFLPINFS